MSCWADQGKGFLLERVSYKPLQNSDGAYQNNRKTTPRCARKDFETTEVGFLLREHHTPHEGDLPVPPLPVSQCPGASAQLVPGPSGLGSQAASEGGPPDTLRDTSGATLPVLVPALTPAPRTEPTPQEALQVWVK